MTRHTQMRGDRALRAIPAALVAMACAWAGPSSGTDHSPETEMKAAYLYKLAPFVDWPASAFEGPSDPLVICIVGADPFGSTLDHAVAGQRVGPRPVTVRRLPVAHGREGCAIMYMGGSRAQSTAQALRAVHGRPVLTVTDGGAGARGMVDFTLVEGKVRFRIDDQAASESGLKISSKLLRLAISVTPRRR
jgi:hypothetical protein